MRRRVRLTIANPLTVSDATQANALENRLVDAHAKPHEIHRSDEILRPLLVVGAPENVLDPLQAVETRQSVAETDARAPGWRP